MLFGYLQDGVKQTLRITITWYGLNDHKKDQVIPFTSNALARPRFGLCCIHFYTDCHSLFLDHKCTILSFLKTGPILENIYNTYFVLSVIKLSIFTEFALSTSKIFQC